MIHLDTLVYDSNTWQLKKNEITDSSDCSIVFLFGDSEVIKTQVIFDELQRLYPHAHIVGGSSSGNILSDEISSKEIVATAIHFEKSSVEISTIDFLPNDDFDKLAMRLVKQLPPDNLQHIFVMLDGLTINASKLIGSLNALGGSYTISGGLAGDGDRFQETWIIANEPARQSRVVAVGFYGDSLTISTGCHGGWDSFGSDRVITRAKDTILFELDGQPALKLYKEYLGDFADELPLSGMRFPLNIRPDYEDKNEIIRTLVAIDEEQQSIIFAGDIPEGYIARLMKANIDNLIEGASKAVESITMVENKRGLGLVVSCVGRRVAMKELVEEELEVMGEILGDNVQLSGFYSYGEIAPLLTAKEHCQLHNQTMTITVLYED